MKKPILALTIGILAIGGFYFAGRHVSSDILTSLNIPNSRQFNLIRCDEPATRRVRVDFLGYDERGQYDIGLRLAWSELPETVLSAREDQLGTLGRGGISGHQIYYAIPLDEQGAPMIEPPPSFFESGTEEQKNLFEIFPNPQTEADAYADHYQDMFKKDYVIIGYEYQFKDSEGNSFRSPYFNILSWQEGLVPNSEGQPTQMPIRYEPDFDALGTITTNSDVWPISKSETCSANGVMESQ